MKTRSGPVINPSKRVLDNGITVVAVEMPHLHTIELAMFIRAGLRFETPENNGISHFLEHMMFRGNSRFKDSISLNREFEKIGRDLKASTQGEYTYYGFSPHGVHLERGMELFADFFIKPTFSDIELERGIILEEYLEDLNAEGDDIDINNLACQLLYEGNALALPTIGTEETIKSINEKMLREYFNSFYVTENMVLAGAGALSEEELFLHAENYFGKLVSKGEGIPRNYFNIQEPQDGPQMLIQEDTDSQIQLQVCFRAFSYNHPDYYPLCLISRMFDDGVCSRLQRTLREDRGLAYSVECRTTSLSDTGTFDIDVTVSPEKGLEVLEILFNEIKTFLSEGATEEELDHVINRYCYDLELDWDDPYKQLVRYGFAQLYSKEISIEEEQDLVRAITLEDIRRVAHEVMVSQKLNVVVLGPRTEKEDQKVKQLVESF